jgi:ABC-type uncharacterized transport system permease subunit
MKKFLKELFNDNNTINEKSVIGAISFLMLVIALAVDLVTGWLGRELLINEFIFNGFMIIALGAFGIASVDKWINKSKPNSEENPNDETPKIDL